MSDGPSNHELFERWHELGDKIIELKRLAGSHVAAGQSAQAYNLREHIEFLESIRRALLRGIQEKRK